MLMQIISRDDHSYSSTLLKMIFIFEVTGGKVISEEQKSMLRLLWEKLCSIKHISAFSTVGEKIANFINAIEIFLWR
jgi:hypothetical protein